MAKNQDLEEMDLSEKLRKIYGLGFQAGYEANDGKSEDGSEDESEDEEMHGGAKKKSVNKIEKSLKKYQTAKCKRTGKVGLDKYLKGLLRKEKLVCTRPKTYRQCVETKIAKNNKKRCAKYESKKGSKIKGTVKQKRAAKNNKWIQAVKAYQHQNKGMTYKEALQELGKARREGLNTDELLELDPVEQQEQEELQLMELPNLSKNDELFRMLSAKQNKKNKKVKFQK